MLDCIKPSSDAVAAQNVLLQRMVTKEGEERLGIQGSPAEGGLFDSLLAASGLYHNTKGRFSFVDPRTSHDPAGLSPLWDATEKYLKGHGDRSVSIAEIYGLWSEKPFGLKFGLMPVLSLAFILSMKACVILYRQNMFQATFKVTDINYLVEDPGLIKLRWMALNEGGQDLLCGLANLVADPHRGDTLEKLEPVDVGRRLIAIFDNVSSWTRRTTRLSPNATRIRGLFEKANDPDRLMFKDLPRLLAAQSENRTAELLENVRAGLEELTGAYPELLNHMRNNMLTDLHVPDPRSESLGELRLRAQNVRQLAGDFHLDTFVGRLATFEGTDADIEGLISLAARKPARDWTDADIDQATNALADLAHKFHKAETFARVKGRPDKRHAMAILVGIPGQLTSFFEEFDVGDAERRELNILIARLEIMLPKGPRNLVLAALAEVSARLINESETDVASYLPGKPGL
jgi:hypothetical protein